MIRRALLPMILLVAMAGGLVMVVSARQPDQPGVRLVLEGRTAIIAGQPWALTVRMTGAQAGDTVYLALFNGLQTLEKDVRLTRNGLAVWHIPAGRLTEAGTSLIIARAGTVESQRTLEVISGAAVEADLFSTANTFAAYGEAGATVLLLPRDAWGNPASDTGDLAVEVRFPDSQQATYPFMYTEGLGWARLRSMGGPGRVRLSLVDASVSGTLELLQTPGEPAQVDLSLDPLCVWDDGRDMVTLTAAVHDAHDHPVADGTLVTFSWQNGFGYGLTLDGVALLRIPGPSAAGRYHYTAKSGVVVSNQAILQVSAGGCAGE